MYWISLLNIQRLNIKQTVKYRNVMKVFSTQKDLEMFIASLLLFNSIFMNSHIFTRNLEKFTNFIAKKKYKNTTPLSKYLIMPKQIVW